MIAFTIFNDKDDAGTLTVWDMADPNHPKPLHPNDDPDQDFNYPLPPGVYSLAYYATALANGTASVMWSCTNAVNQQKQTVTNQTNWNLSDGTQRFQ